MINIKYIISSTLAVFERQLYILWRKKIYLFTGILLPVFFILGIGPALENLTLKVSTEYVASGIICFTVIFGSMQGPFSLIYDRDTNYLNIQLVSPIPRFSIILGVSLAGAFRAIIECILMYIIAIGTGIANFYISPLHIIGFLICAILISVFIEGLFSSLLSIIKDTETFSLVSNFISMPFIFLSNAFFPTSSYRNTPFFWVEQFGYFNPVNYALNTIRYFLMGYCPDYLTLEPWIGPLSVIIIGILALSFTFIGTYLFLYSVKK